MNILFTCAGRRTYLLKYFKMNMEKGDKVVATDMQLSAPALQAADVKIIVPGVYSPDYVDIILTICKEQKIDVLISLNDLELPILSKCKARFGDIGVKVIISDPDIIEIASDKFRTAQWAESIGLNVPKTFSNLSDAKKALSRGEIAFPLILKPRWGSGSIGVESADDMEELEIYYKILNKKVPKTILAQLCVGDEIVVIQEKLTGDEYGLDVMNDLEGNYVGVSVKKKISMRSGETDKAITVDIPALRELGEMMGKTLKHISNLDVDIIQRSNGDYCIIDINPRFGGGFPFSYEAGVNMPEAIIKWAKGEPVNPSTLVPEYGRMFAKNDYLIEISDIS